MFHAIIRDRQGRGVLEVPIGVVEMSHHLIINVLRAISGGGLVTRSREVRLADRLGGLRRILHVINREWQGGRKVSALLAIVERVEGMGMTL